MVLELTDSIRGYSCSFLILLSRLICHNSSGFPFLPLGILQTSVQALLPIPRERCSQGSSSGRQLLCSFVGNSPHFFSNYHCSADDSQVYILKLQICTDCLFLDIASWITRLLHTCKPGLICPKAKTLAVFLCHLVLSISTQFVKLEAWDAS